MAKFNVTVELDWVDEEGSIDGALKEQIASQIISKVSASSIKDITEKVDAQIISRVDGAVSAKLAEALDDFLNRPRTVTDKWGDTEKEGVSVIQMMKDACDNYLEQEVDANGKTAGRYCDKRQTRINYLISSQIDYKLKSAIDSAVERIKVGIQEYVKSTMQEKLTESISKAIGLDQIVNSMK